LDEKGDDGADGSRHLVAIIKKNHPLKDGVSSIYYLFLQQEHLHR